jgi:hypothetical protein
MMKSVSALKAFIVFVSIGGIVKAGPYNEPGSSYSIDKTHDILNGFSKNF